MEQLLDAPKNSHTVLVLLAKMVVPAKNRGKRSNVNAPTGGVEKIALKVRYRVLLVIAAMVESFTYNLIIFFFWLKVSVPRGDSVAMVLCHLIRYCVPYSYPGL